jgi:hypothetical protein
LAFSCHKTIPDPPSFGKHPSSQKKQPSGRLT